MTVVLADPLRYAFFCFTNSDKATNSMRVDQKERGLVAMLQLKNAASDVLDLSKGKQGKIAKGLTGVSTGIHAARESSKVFDSVCKGVNVLSKLVNPILVVASMVRAWKSDDKKSAAIRETGAMTFMFGGEWAFKSLFGLGGKTACYKNIKPVNAAVNAAKGIMSTNKYLSKLPANKVIGLLKAIGFIITSCGMFELGSKTGQAIADRTTAKAYAKEHSIAPETKKTSNVNKLAA